MTRLINIGLLLSFSICYLEWGGGNSSFLFQVEYVLFTKQADFLATITHPIIMFGLIGQLLLIISLIMSTPKKIINHIGVLMLSAIVLLVLVAGLLSFNIRIVASTLPFISLSVMYVIYYRRLRRQM